MEKKRASVVMNDLSMELSSFGIWGGKVIDKFQKSNNMNRPLFMVAVLDVFQGKRKRNKKIQTKRKRSFGTNVCLLKINENSGKNHFPTNMELKTVLQTGSSQMSLIK